MTYEPELGVACSLWAGFFFESQSSTCSQPTPHAPDTAAAKGEGKQSKMHL